MTAHHLGYYGDHHVLQQNKLQKQHIQFEPFINPLFSEEECYEFCSNLYTSLQMTIAIEIV